MEKSAVLKPIGATLLVGGVVMLISGLWASLLGFKLGAVLAIPSFLVFTLAAVSEISTGQSVWKAIMGSWRGIVSTLALVVVIRLLMLFFGWSHVFSFSRGFSVSFAPTLEVILFWCNLALVVAEGGILAYLYRRSDLFMTQDHGDRNFLETTTKTVSECPSCHEVVEAYWQSCPYCGTSLPRVCGDCGHDLGDLLTKCPHCGKEVMDVESMNKTIATFRALVQEDALPETKATRYARLAEALLKNGDTAEAVAAYREAIRHTAFPRKRTNFMVQAARILKNTGKSEDALVLLDEALKLDAQDVAGAAKLRAEIRPT